MTTAMSPALVHHISLLAHIPIIKEEERSLADDFVATLKVVEKLMKIDTSSVKHHAHMSRLFNVFRDDQIDENRMFTQEQALMNAHKAHSGYFVVDQILDQE